MKVLTISNQTTGHGAYARQRRMASALIEAGHKVIWIAPGMENPGEEILLSMDTKWLPNLGPVSFLIGLHKTFERHAKELSDVDVTFTVSEYAALACKSHSVIKNAPHIFFQRGNTLEIEKFNLKYPISFKDMVYRPLTIIFYPYLQRYLYSKLDLIVVQADFLKKKITESFPKLRVPISILPNDCNIKWVHEDVTHEDIAKIGNHTVPGVQTIGLVAPAYWHGKGFDVFLGAVQRLKNINEYQAFLIGYGPDEKRIRKQIQDLGLEDKVRFLGGICNAYQCMNQFDIMVIPTRMTDACPNVVLEAMAAETAILASNIAAHRALLEYPELLFESEDQADLARKIKALLRDETELELNKRLVRNQKKKFSFDWDKEVVSLISGVVNGKNE